MGHVQEFMDKRDDTLRRIDAALEQLLGPEDGDLDVAHGGTWVSALHDEWVGAGDSDEEAIVYGVAGTPTVSRRAHRPERGRRSRHELDFVDHEGSCCPHEADPMGALPALHAPAGYRRDKAGVWRYDWGGTVPGARDDCLARRYRFAAHGASAVRIPQHLCTQPDLEWVLDHDVGAATNTVRWHGVEAPAVIVLRQCWQSHAYVPLGLYAPELAPHALLDTERAALRLGVQPSTISSYRARRKFPEPQFVVSNSPLWSVPVLEHWRATR